MAEDIQVALGATVRTFTEADAPITIGSGPSAALRSTQPGVAAEHARLEVASGRWSLVSVGGSPLLVSGQQVPKVAVGGGVEVTLGIAGSGAHLAISLGGVRPPQQVPAPPPPHRIPDPGRRADVPVDPTIAGPVQGEALRVRHGGTELVFQPGRVVTFGRRSTSDVVLDNPLVSGAHAEARYGAKGWQLHDTGSKRGIFHGGSQVTAFDLQGVSTVHFAEEGAGEKVVFVAPGETRTTRTASAPANRTLLVVGAGVLVLVLLVGLLFATRDSGSDEAEFDTVTLAKGTVKIAASVDGQEGGWTGSGTIISDDGLILTNAHVAAPATQGDGEDPDQLIVYINENGDDRAVEPTYLAETVAADGPRDLAVIRIVKTLGGNEATAEELRDLTTIPLGTDPEVGTEIEVLGYPGVAKSLSVTVTRGIVGSYTEGPAGPKQIINTDAKIEMGNSGGLAADRRGRIVAVPTRFDCTTAEDADGYQVVTCDRGRQDQMTAISIARPLIEAVEQGKSYRVVGTGD